MNKKLLWLLPLMVTVLMAPGLARADDASNIMAKMRQLDLMNQLLPVLLTNDQAKKLLTPIEKARQAVADIEKKELEEMKKVEPSVDSALKAAKEKGELPPKNVQQAVFVLLQSFQKRREAMVIEQTEGVLKVVEETFDAGQIKAASNSLSVPESESGKLSDRDKLRRWVQAVLMDPLCYDLLVDISRKK